jgi:multidrug efflux pump subunit AcrB
MEKSLVKLYNKVMSNREMLPPGAGEPLVVPKSIDDVPIVTLTLWSGRYDSHTLRRVARELCDELKKSVNVAETGITGSPAPVHGAARPRRLAAYGLSPLR